MVEMCARVGREAWLPGLGNAKDCVLWTFEPDLCCKLLTRACLVIWEFSEFGVLKCCGVPQAG